MATVVLWFAVFHKLFTCEKGGPQVLSIQFGGVPWNEDRYRISCKKKIYYTKDRGATLNSSHFPPKFPSSHVAGFWFLASGITCPSVVCSCQPGCSRSSLYCLFLQIQFYAVPVGLFYFWHFWVFRDDANFKICIALMTNQVECLYKCFLKAV